MLTGSMSAFEAGSGLSTTWLNHFIIVLAGTVVLIVASGLIVMLKHRLDIADGENRIWVIFYVLMLVFSVTLFLGFFHSCWR